MTQHTEFIKRLRYEPTASQYLSLADLIASLHEDRKNAADALEAQAREIAKIEQENDLLRQHAAKQISDTTLLTGIDISNGSMNMGLQGGAAQLLAESFFDQFQKSEAVNYLELRFESESKMPGKAMVVTLQLVGGVTPGQRIAEQVREIEGLRKDAERFLALERIVHWEQERDMGPGGRYWVAVHVSSGNPTLREAIDAMKGQP
jgi:hypothetical protein